MQLGKFASNCCGAVSKGFERILECSHDAVRRGQEGIRWFPNIKNAEWYDWLGFLWMWFFLNVFVLGFKGYALYVFLGGTASLYLHLRRDVDGTDEEEILLEGEEEAVPEPQPRWVGESGAPPEPGAEEPGAET